MFLRLISKFPCSLMKLSFSTSQLISPDLIDLHFSKGKEKLKNPNFLASALESFEKSADLCSQLFPLLPLKQIEILIEAAIELAKNNNLNESQNFLNQAASQLKTQTLNDLQTDANDLHNKLGFLYYELKDYKNAENFLSAGFRLIEGEIDESKILNSKKIIELKILLNKDSEGIDLCEKTVNLIRDNEKFEIHLRDIYLLYGKCLLNLKNKTKGNEMYNNALKLTKKNLNKFKIALGDNILISTYEIIIKDYINNKFELSALNIALVSGEIVNLANPIEYYANIYKYFTPGDHLEPLIKRILDLNEKSSKESEQSRQIYKLMFKHYDQIHKKKESLEYSEKFLKLSEKLQKFDGIIEAYDCSARAYLNTDLNKAKKFIDLGQEYLVQIPDNESQQKFNYSEFLYHLYSKDFDNAEKFILLCIENCPKTQEFAGKHIMFYHDYSYVFLNKQQLELALNPLLSANEVSEKYLPRLHPLNIVVYEKTGLLYYMLGNVEKSLKFLFSALNILIESKPKDYFSLIALKSKIMGIYWRTDQLKLSEKISEEIIQVIKALGSSSPRKEIAQFYLELGKLYDKKKELLKARECFMKSKEIYSHFGDQDLMSLADSFIIKLDY